jgi:hypothetical protein
LTRCTMGLIVRGAHPIAPVQQNRTSLPGGPRAWGGEKPVPARTNQIEGKKLPAFKILLLRHHPPPCGEQVVWETRVAKRSGNATSRLTGHWDRWARGRRPDRTLPDPKSVSTKRGGRARSGRPTRRRCLFTVWSGFLYFPRHLPGMGRRSRQGLGEECVVR